MIEPEPGPGPLTRWATSHGLGTSLVGIASLKRDSLFLPIQFVTQVLPAELAGRYRYDSGTGRLEELTGRAPPASPPAPGA